MRALLLLAAFLSLEVLAQQALVAPGLGPGARFGAAIAGTASCWSSEPYETVAVGAPHGTVEAPGPGSVSVFSGAHYTPTAWTFLRTVASPTGLDGDLFGASLSGSCDFVGWLVGAPGAEQAFHYPYTLREEAAYRIRLDGSSLGPGSEFGRTVLGTGGSLLVGAPGAAADSGRVLSFGEYDLGGPPVIAPRDTLAPSHPDDRRFGASLATAYGRLFVGAPGGVTGAVYVFVHTGGPYSSAWRQVARIAGPAGFGASLSADVMRVSNSLWTQLAVASPQTNEVYVYREGPGAVWAVEHVYESLESVPTGQIGTSGVAFLRVLNGPYYVLASGPGASHGPVSYGSSPHPTVPLPFYSETPSSSYGVVAGWTNRTFRFAVGDPGAGGTGGAWTGDRSLLPVAPVASEAPTTQSALVIRAFPQPANQSVSLRVTSAEPVRLLVADALGRVVWQGTATGSSDLTLDTSHWAAGVYGVRAEAGRAVATGRLVVAR